MPTAEHHFISGFAIGHFAAQGKSSTGLIRSRSAAGKLLTRLQFGLGSILLQMETKIAFTKLDGKSKLLRLDHFGELIRRQISLAPMNTNDEPRWRRFQCVESQIDKRHIGIVDIKRNRSFQSAAGGAPGFCVEVYHARLILLRIRKSEETIRAGMELQGPTRLWPFLATDHAIR